MSHLRVLLLTILATILAGCGLLVPASTGVPTEAGEAGMGLPHQLPGETYPGERRELDGELVYDEQGCVHLDVDGETYFVIWPAGSEWSAPVRLPDGSELSPGDRVTGFGALTPSAPLTAERNGYWAYAVGFCAPDADEVLVLDEVRRD